jgi:hypothetical protein
VADNANDGKERRRRVRHYVYLAAELVVEGTTPRTAITKDISEIGLLLLTRAELKMGQEVDLKIYLPGEEMRAVVVRGKVVRLEELSDEEKGIWRDKVAFTFDDPQPELAKEFEKLAAEQAKVYDWS